MTNNFKPGDLALIINSRNSENIGRVVTVTGFAKSGDFIPTEAGRTFVSRDDCIVVDGKIIVSKPSSPEVKHTVSKHAFRRGWLMPLRGDFAPEQTKSREVSA